MSVKQSKKRIIAAVLAVIFLGLAGGGYYFYANYVSPFMGQEQEEQGKQSKAKKKQEMFFKKPVNILVLGIDQRGKEKSRTDTIMIYRLDPIKKEVRLFSIPRDTYVNIPGRGMDKINHAHAFGDIPLSIQTIEGFLGIKIDHYVRVNFEGFKDLIDLVGGVEVDVEKNINRGGIVIKKGLQRLSSEQALVYVRDRYDPMGDIERVKRQQKFIRALVKEVNSFEPKWKLARVVPDIYSNVETDVPMKAGNEVLALMKDVDVNNAQFERVPGTFYNKNGISYWKPNLDETSALVNKIFKEETPVAGEPNESAVKN